MMKTWNQVPFESLYAEPSRNGLMRPKRVRGDGYPMINMGELFAYERIMGQPMDLVPMSKSEIEKYAVKSGDLLFARQSLVAEGTGKCSIVLKVPQTTTFESHLIRVRLDRTKAAPLFYHYYYASRTGRANVQSIMMQVAAAGIRASELALLQVPQPPLLVQKRIAQVLSAFDDLIENDRRRISVLEEIVRKIYCEWFVELRVPGVRVRNATSAERQVTGKKEVPADWMLRELCELATLHRGKSYRSSELAEEGGLPFLNLKCIDREGGFRRIGIKRFVGEAAEAYFAKKGDIIIAVTDMTQERRIVGRAAMVPSLDAEYGVFSMDLVRLEPKAGVPNYYLYCLLRFSSFADQVKQAANGVNVLHLAPRRIEEYRVLAPSQLVMDRFAELAGPVLDLMDGLEIQAERLRNTRDFLLPRLTMGEVSVEDLDIAGIEDVVLELAVSRK